MRLSALESIVSNMDKLHFYHADGQQLPVWLHLTELGHTVKSMIDCGNQIHHLESIELQLWDGTDENHRLEPKTMLAIIRSGREKLGLPDEEIVVSWQNGNSIGLFGLEFMDNKLVLTNTKTQCIPKANDPNACCAPALEVVSFAELPVSGGCCGSTTVCC
jgi:Family of unknown function (DUF6428)